MSKHMVGTKRSQITICRRFTCQISKATRAQACARARAPTHARTHALTHTHTEVCKIIVFPQQQWLRECASILRYTFPASLVKNTLITRENRYQI